MAEVAALGLKVSGVSSIQEATLAMDKLTKSSSQAEKTTIDFGKSSDKASKDVDKLVKSTEASSKKLDGMAKAAKSAGGILAAAFSTKALIDYTDTWSDLSSRVGLAIQPHEDVAEVMSRLSDIARMTYSDLNSTAESFSNNSTTLRALGKSTEGMLNYTEALNNALVVSGAKADRAQLVQNALSRAMAEGTLKANELNLVLNSGSRVAEALADELGVNITELRGLAAQGKITGDTIYNSLTKRMTELAGEAESMPATIADGFQLIRNAILETIGVYDQANGLSEEFAENIVMIADIIRDTDWSPYINGLSTAAKIYAAYLVTVKAVPAATALATASKTAYTAAMAAFTVQTAAANVQLTRQQMLLRNTQKALNIAAAAYMGWEIGTYLRKEFEIVEKAGIALMSGLHQSAIYIEGIFQVMGERIKFAILDPINFARGAIADFLQWVNGLGADALRLLGFDGVAANIENDFANIRGTVASEHNAMLDRIRENTRKEMNAVSDIYFEMFDEVGKAAETTGKKANGVLDVTTGKVTKLTGEVGKLTDEVANALAALERQVAILGKSSDEVVLYDLALQGATGAQLAYARSLLDTIKAYELSVEQGEAYKNLVMELRTDEEVLNDQLKERLAILDAIGTATQQDYSRTAAEAFQEAPRYGGLAPEVGGAFGELNKIEEAREALEDWYATQLEMLETYRAERADLNEQWDEQEAALTQAHQEQLAEIEKARQMAQLAAGQEFFGSMADITKAFFGENSKLYQAAFIMEKSYAIAKALLNAPKAYSDAYAAVVGIPYVGPVLAPAAGMAASAAMVAQATLAGSVQMKGMAHSGIDSVPETGTWLLEKGERVTTASTSAKLDATLDRVNHNQSKGGDVIINLNEDKSKAGQVQERSGEDDDQRIIDIWVADLMGDGRTAQALQSRFPLQPHGV